MVSSRSLKRATSGRVSAKSLLLFLVLMSVGSLLNNSRNVRSIFPSNDSRESRTLYRILLDEWVHSVAFEPTFAPPSLSTNASSSSNKWIPTLPYKTLQNAPRNCTSPESHIAWPFQGETQSLSSNLTCGSLSDSKTSQFFTTLASSLNATFGYECRKGIRFGVAFGEGHMHFINSTLFKMKSLKCTVTFVLEEDLQAHGSSHTSTELVAIPRGVLPYKNMRRNVKLIKLNGHLLFPFARLLVWQDAKLNRMKKQRPARYFEKLLSSPNKSLTNRPCLVVMGMPQHKSAFGEVVHTDGYEPRYQDHCETVVSAIQHRPTVTDSTETLMHQCRSYQDADKQYWENNDIVSLDRGLIDSAFMVFNQQSERCREFNKQVACTWSDEIQCYSDR